MALTNFGTVKRKYPRVEVLRGYNPQSSLTLTQAHPVSLDNDGNPIVIYSGQVISPKLNVNTGVVEWVLGLEAGAIPHIALNDSADWDVVAADKLPALSSLGEFEIQIPFFTGDAATFVEGAALTPDGVTGSLKVSTAKGQPIVGYVTRSVSTVAGGNYTAALQNVNKTNSNAQLDSNGNLFVVTFTTRYDANPA